MKQNHTCRVAQSLKRIPRFTNRNELHIELDIQRLLDKRKLGTLQVLLLLRKRYRASLFVGFGKQY